MFCKIPKSMFLQLWMLLQSTTCKKHPDKLYRRIILYVGA